MKRVVAVIRWRGGGRVYVEGLPEEDLARLARRWCGVVRHDSADVPDPACTLVAQPLMLHEHVGEPSRIRLTMQVEAESASLMLRVGPHSVVTGGTGQPDVIRYSERRQPSSLEAELLLDLAMNHVLARQGRPVLHACAIESEGVGVLGLGRTHSGKTTVAVAAMRAGGRVVSDDAVLVVPEGERFAVLPVRSYGWLRGRTREIVPSELQDRMIENEENGQPRWVLNREDGGEAFVERAVPNVIWVQSVDRRLKLSRIEPVDQGKVFAGLIRASSPLFLSRHCPEIRDQLIPVFRSLCAQCRGYRVRLGRELLEEPAREITRLVELSR